MNVNTTTDSEISSAEKNRQETLLNHMKMPPTKDFNFKQPYGRSFSNNEMTMSARVYHPATNLMPPTPPVSPTGLAPQFPPPKTTTSTWGRQNSHNGKYS